LEERLNLALVRRGNSFQGFTSEGEVVLKWARKLLADEEGMRQEIAALGNDLNGTLSLGVIPTAMPFAARVSAKLRQEHPNISIEIYSESTQRIARKINDFSLDAGILYYDGGDRETTVKLYEERYVFIAPKALITSNKKQITWAEVSQIPLCLLTPNMKNRQLIDKHFFDLEILPKIVTEASDFTAVLAQVAGGNAATIAPVSVAETFLDLKSTVQLDLTHPVMTHTVGLSIKDQSPVLPMIEALRRAVQLAL
jgi:DNA-binding transcriptional LysR family regulator